MYKIIYSIILIIFLCACNNSQIGPQYDLAGYQTESAVNGLTFAEYRDQDDNLLVKGQLLNGIRNGTWVTYRDNSNKIKKITTYIQGLKNGIEITMNDRGQIESREEFKNDILHGFKVAYTFGQPTEETSYKDGQFDGPFTIYANRKIQRKGFFKNGKQHGTLEYFNDKGEVTLRYEYENGEKISGGIVELPAASE
ncbi:MAG: antitoxin component YwqK of YwqJK toxin-antitoxin module [Saprospiraceae bacterium]|jgi:antitoxin component YwqK of YwqJK toxin-antitoxin module